jgi:mannitol-1-phosphate 5-dehydrogenase
MARRGNATFVGFGFGAIQAGLFCYEAARSGVFRDIVVAEIMPTVVADVRAAGGNYMVNVAHAGHIETVTVGPVRLEDPAQVADRARLVEAIAAAQEIATAVPNVQAYRSPGRSSLHRVLAEGLQRKVAVAGPVAVIYAAENNPRAAELLRAAVMEEVPEAERAAVERQVAFVNTVIGKMGGLVSPPGDLAPLTPSSDRALLVEAFNHILVAQSHFAQSYFAQPRASFASGFPTFFPQEELAPFEDAKLLGHNGIHALAAYVGAAAGLPYMADLATTPGMMPFMRDAFIEEAGAGLIHRYAGADDLFTPEGFAAYASDLLERMVNAHLRDSVARVSRDPQRKLGWDDRLIGAVRLAHAAGVHPGRFAFGAAAALHLLDPAADPAVLLPALWRQAAPAPDGAATMLALVQRGAQHLKTWREAGCPNLATWWAENVATAA